MTATSEPPKRPVGVQVVPTVSHSVPQARAIRARHDATRTHMGYVGYVGYVLEKYTTCARLGGSL